MERKRKGTCEEKVRIKWKEWKKKTGRKRQEGKKTNKKLIEKKKQKEKISKEKKEEW